MRRTPRPPISDHRLARLNAYLRLFLIWFVGVFAVGWASGARYHRRQLDRIACGVANVVIANACVRLPAKARRRSGNRHGRVKHASLRAIRGWRLSRALDGRDWPSRLAAILAVVRDLDAHVAALARRLRSGLTRLRVIDPKPESPPALPLAPHSAAVFADSS